MDTFILNWNIDENGILIRENRSVQIPIEIIQEKCRTQIVPKAENDAGIMINDPSNPNSNVLLTFREFQNVCESHMQRSDHQGRRMHRFIRNHQGQIIPQYLTLRYIINRPEEKFGLRVGGKKENQSKKRKSIKKKKINQKKENQSKKNSRRFFKNRNKI
jgi:hypothetical protein